MQPLWSVVPDGGRARDSLQRAPVGIEEAELASRTMNDPKPSLVQSDMVSVADEDQVAQRRRAAVGPVLDMVSIDKRSVAATGKATPAITQPERARDGRRHRPPPAADVQYIAALARSGDDEPAVTGEAEQCRATQRRAVMKLSLPGLDAALLLRGDAALGQVNEQRPALRSA
jgi:hypothetical protein